MILRAVNNISGDLTFWDIQNPIMSMSIEICCVVDLGVILKRTQIVRGIVSVNANEPVYTELILLPFSLVVGLEIDLGFYLMSRL